MNKVALTALVALCVISAPASAVTLRGTQSCGAWVNDRHGVYAVPNLTWVIGFLSGLALESNKDFLRGTDNDSISVWIDNYCHAHPLNDLSDASQELAVELVRRKGL